MSSKISADINYINANAEILLNYDSKNAQLSEDPLTLSDTTAISYIMNIANAVTADDLRWAHYSALLNGAPINTHALLWDGILNPRQEDITITIS